MSMPLWRHAAGPILPTTCAAALAITLAGCAHQPRWPEPEKQAMAALGLPADQSQLLTLTIVRDADVAADVATSHEQTSSKSAADHLPLAQAIEDTLRHSPAIRQALWDVKIAQAQAHQARLLPNPVVSVMLRWPEGGGQPSVEAGIAGELLSLLKMPAQIGEADAQLRAASAAAVTVVLDEIATTQTLYAQLQAGQAVHDVLTRQHELAQEMTKLAQSQLDAGQASRLTVTTLQASALQLHIDLQQQRVDIRQLELALARQLGRPAAQATWSLDDWSSPAAPAQADEASWVRAALAHRPEIQQAIATLEARGAQLSSAGMTWLSGEVGVEAEREDGNWSIGPSAAMALPIFDWGQASKHEARAQQQQAAWALIDTRRKIIQEVRQAHASWRARLDMLRSVDEQLMPLLDSQQMLTQQAFRAGQEDVTAVLLSGQNQQTASLGRIQWQLQTQLALIALQRAAGGAGVNPSSTVTTTSPSSND